MSFQKIRHLILVPLLSLHGIAGFLTIAAQQNLLLNGNFEDINTCSEYKSECGVEGWFYLRDIKAQMLSNDENNPSLGNNSFAIYVPWNSYTAFSPVLGTILPCRLQKGNHYSFRGMIQAKLNNRLVFQPGVVMGEKYYVPRRPFSSAMIADTISKISQIPKTNFYEFEYSFIATGTEKYLTFGTFIREDTVGARRALVGNQTVSIVLDNFELISSDTNEVACDDYLANKEKIYRYDFRHKDMDYSLYGKGELPISFNGSDSGLVTIHRSPMKDPVLKTDTLSLGDVFFDFNKAALKTTALDMLHDYFKQTSSVPASIDSIYVDGHTDSIGSESKNLILSRERCNSIKTWLIQNNIATSDRIIIRPFGKSKPIASNTTAAGRAMNRRVQIIIFR